MSHLPSETLSYEAVVSEYFLGLRGAGLMLSPLDLELVRSWERRGVPVAVVCRGLRRGFSDALRDRPLGSSAPRALRAYRHAVEDEWRSYCSGRVGDAPEPPAEATAAAQRLTSARSLLESSLAAAHGTGREAYRSAWLAVRDIGPAPTLDEVEEALLAADDALVRGWLAALPRPERSALGPRCLLRAGRRPPGMRRRAYRETLRAHLLDAARAAGLLCLRGSV